MAISMEVVMAGVGDIFKAVKGTNSLKNNVNAVTKAMQNNGLSYDNAIKKAEKFTSIDNIFGGLAKKFDAFAEKQKVFKAIESKRIMPKQGVFDDGQVLDAYSFINELIRSAGKEIILVDNYVDDSVLTLFSKTKVKVTIYTKKIDKKLELDLKKYGEQHGNVNIIEFDKSHDRFIVIDKQVYHIGASLKDLGKRWFAFCKLEGCGSDLLDGLK